MHIHLMFFICIHLFQAILKFTFIYLFFICMHIHLTIIPLYLKVYIQHDIHLTQYSFNNKTFNIYTFKKYVYS